MLPADHFSQQSDAYKEFRPTYPAEVFDWLAQTAPARQLAWDCGCGNGQATRDLANRFERVIGTDISEKQLQLAERLVNVSYRLEPAEKSSIESGTVDLVFVAQALHWFRFSEFYAEVRRVSKPGALFAALVYHKMKEVSPSLRSVLRELDSNKIGSYWPEGRRHAAEDYRSIPFPFEKLAAPKISLIKQWYLAQFLGYAHSWSAVARFKAATGTDPIVEFVPRFREAWGDPAAKRVIEWPLTILAGFVL
jgi:SAM-dependent methyltransferase